MLFPAGFAPASKCRANTLCVARLTENVMRVFVSLWILGMMFALAGARTLASQASDDAQCLPFYKGACSEALGAWLPRFARIGTGPAAAPTTVVDTIVDPGGFDHPGSFGQGGPIFGTFFVYGKAGPTKGTAVYDPAHRIVYYAEGCCTWHHVVVASEVGPPPKPLAARSLSKLRSSLGIKLGDPPSRIRVTYGPASFHSVSGSSTEQVLRYVHPLDVRRDPTCDDMTTFLFDRGRLIGMDFRREC